VTGVGEVAKELVAVVEGLDELDVHAVGAAEVGIVHHHDVPGDQVLAQADHRLHGELHRAHEDGQARLALGDDLPGDAVVDAVGAVARLGDDGREGGALQGQVGFIDRLLEAVLHDGQRDGIDPAG
jgi:hypothetical protein